ncbi:DMT family transporter [Nonomuraea sp. SMC257]|uniref:DMT family transporter n=1 Tax=Nonomuraea montanisoli TaxID=2741721 RepID=A0A7Y6I564_9ACTN|nr:DMT family transporter [Nonomuraea montanisoli]NUW31917.1 DMT family transporter [Nonomuraea montanisoli]
MNARAWGAFGAVSLLWGLPYLLLKVGVDGGLSPGFLAWARVVLGAVTLLVLVPRKAVRDAFRGRVRWLAAFAVAEVVLPFPLIAVGEQHVSSSLAATLIAAAPLFVALLALRFDVTERVTGRRLAGLLAGLAGVAALVGVDVSGRPDELLGAAAILCAAFCYAVGPMILKRRLADLDPRVSMAAVLLLSSVLLAPAAALDPPRAMPSAGVITAVVLLGVLCTAAAMVFYGMLVAEAGAGRALVITYVNPVVAVILGMALLGERPGAGMAVGLPLILLGSWLSTGRAKKPRVTVAARDGSRSCPPVPGTP